MGYSRQLIKTPGFLPIKMDYKFGTLSHLCMDVIAYLHEIPTNILSNRDARFIPKF